VALARLTPALHTVWVQDPAVPDVGLDGVRGPWPLMHEVWQRDPANREGHLRFLACLYPQHGGSATMMWQFAQWAAGYESRGSDLHLLVLYAYAEHYRDRTTNPDRSDLALEADRQWSDPTARSRALRLYGGDLDDQAGVGPSWFELAGARPVAPVADLSYLAHALFAGRQLVEAGRVLALMGPYAATMPWSLFGRADAVLAAARRRCGLSPP
jgi:hypothetical protein